MSLGDFAALDVDERYELVFVVFNTFFSLLTQDDQVRCFRNVAGHLRPGGRFVLEAFVPDLTRFDRGQRVAATGVDIDAARLDVTQHHRATQRIDSMHVVLCAGGVELYPVRGRYAYPSELDLMARMAGLALEHRWGGWRDEPFTDDSSRHVSVYRA